MLNCNIKDFGAVGDGKTINTNAIQNAIDECTKAGGGRVTVSDGTYVTGTIFLKNGVEVYIETDGVIAASIDCNDYLDIISPYTKTNFMSLGGNKKALIYAEECDGISISGKGVIDCRGNELIEPDYEGSKGKNFDPAMHGWTVKRKDSSNYPARIIYFAACTNVNLEQFTLINPPACWSTWFLNCERMTIQRVNIDCDTSMPNSDGLHFTGCSDVVVSNCYLKCGDDCIVIRSNPGGTGCSTPKPCERIVVTNCNLVSHSAAIRVGWISDYIMRDCSFSNLTISNSHSGIVMYYKDSPYFDRNEEYFNLCNETEYAENACTERMSFNNIIMSNIKCQPIRFFSDTEIGMGKIRNINFSNMFCVSEQFPTFIGCKKNIIEDITLNNITFKVKELPELNELFCNVSKGDMEVGAESDEIKVRNIKRLKMDNVIFE